VIITAEEAQRKLRNQADRAFRALVLEAGARIIFRTPVGNPDDWKVPRKGYVGGRARSNWHTSVGSPKFTADELKAGEGGRGEAAITSFPATGAHRMRGGPSANKAVMELIRNGNSADAGDVVFVTNGLPYIKRLEYESWSKQAPAGMVRVTLAELRPLADRVAERIRRAQ
jgi:hypothetical protein